MTLHVALNTWQWVSGQFGVCLVSANDWR